MSVSSQMQAAGIQMPGSVPANNTGATTPPSTPPKTGAKADNKTHEEFVAMGEKIAQSLTEEQKQIEGSKRDKVAFLQCLGDATKPVKRTEGGNPNVPTFFVIGYAFKALEDMTVPVAPYKAGAKTVLDVEPATERVIKAGTEFYLNIVETGLLISRPEYCGQFTGEGTTVQFSVKFSKDNKEPKPVLLKVGGGSIKSNIVCVNNTSKDATGKLKHEGCKAGYEAFEPYFVKKTASRVGAGKATRNESAKALSYAFAAYMRNKK